MDTRYIETTNYLKSKFSEAPEIGIILGTGLGGFIQEMQVDMETAYADIPHFPLSTVEHHSGKLIFGKIDGKSTVVMQGRFHLYEGYDMLQVTYPLRVMKLLGIHMVLISNISGAMNLKYRKGDLVIIEDHINLQPGSPLTGANDIEFGPRFPDMSEPYNKELIQLGWKIAKEEDIRIHTGVYVAVHGPNLETRAEYRYLRKIGADIVGMSTVPEVIVARHMELRVFAISLVTDECDPDKLQPISISEIIEIAKNYEPKLTRILVRLIGKL